MDESKCFNFGYIKKVCKFVKIHKNIYWKSILNLNTWSFFSQSEKCPQEKLQSNNPGSKYLLHKNKQFWAWVAMQVIDHIAKVSRFFHQTIFRTLKCTLLNKNSLLSVAKKNIQNEIICLMRHFYKYRYSNIVWSHSNFRGCVKIVVSLKSFAIHSCLGCVKFDEISEWRVWMI